MWANDVIALRGQTTAVRMDVADEASVAAAVTAVEQEFGRIDALINNAALFTQLQRRPLTDVVIAEWRRVMDVNLAGPFITTRAVVEPMKRVGGGSIINVATSGSTTGRTSWFITMHRRQASSDLLERPPQSWAASTFESMQLHRAARRRKR
jgi:NAD(P)-dependent dehydrogenase (short-subunit alcohol dehydrogenase family)